MINKIKAALFKVLKMNGYLWIAQKTYLFAYRSGVLRNNPAYRWHYFVSAVLKDGDHILDIGANLGYFTAAFSKKVKTSGHLYCVEPVLPFQKQLQRLIGNNPNITLLPFALGEETGRQVTLGIPAQFEKLGYLRHGTTTLLHSNNHGKYAFSATMKKGSELFINFPKLDYIKCDIEGYETIVFPEMKTVLEKFQPMVQLETWGKQLLTMYTFFKDLGFAAFYLENNQLHSLEKKAVERWGESDLLFVPPAKMYRIAPFLQ